MGEFSHWPVLESIALADFLILHPLTFDALVRQLCFVKNIFCLI